MCFGTSCPANHAIELYIRGRRLASMPIRRYLFIDYIINLFIGVPLKIILTKIDKICSEVEDNSSNVFKSKGIKEQVDNVSQLFGIPRNHVLLVKNYESEIEMKQNVNILALMTLRHLLRATRDYMFNFQDDEEITADLE